MTTQEKAIHHSQYKSTGTVTVLSITSTGISNRSVTNFIAGMSVIAIISRSTDKLLHYDIKGGYITASVSLSKSDNQ